MQSAALFIVLIPARPGSCHAVPFSCVLPVLHEDATCLRPLWVTVGAIDREILPIVSFQLGHERCQLLPVLQGCLPGLSLARPGSSLLPEHSSGFLQRGQVVVVCTQMLPYGAQEEQSDRILHYKHAMKTAGRDLQSTAGIGCLPKDQGSRCKSRHALSACDLNGNLTLRVSRSSPSLLTLPCHSQSTGSCKK